MNVRLKSNPDLTLVVSAPVTDARYFSIGWGSAVRLENEALQATLNSGLAAIKGNCTYKTISNKYFSQLRY
ncbi:MAG: transporter substrate-binding domain-containing protein [Serratia symbiotica]|nr:transporter substrate-binding domain-containing protein [Serratia symbiotica]